MKSCCSVQSRLLSSVEIWSDMLCLLWLAKDITFMTLLILCGLSLFNCALSTVCYAILLVLVDGRFGRNYSKLGNGVSDVPREAQNLYPRGSLNLQLCDCDWHPCRLNRPWNYHGITFYSCYAIVCRCPVSNIALTTNCVFLSASGIQPRFSQHNMQALLWHSIEFWRNVQDILSPMSRQLRQKLQCAPQ